MVKRRAGGIVACCGISSLVGRDDLGAACTL